MVEQREQLHQQQPLWHAQQQYEQATIEQDIQSYAVTHEPRTLNGQMILQRVTVPQQHNYVLQQQNILRHQQALQHQLNDKTPGLELPFREEQRRPSSLLSQASVARGKTPSRAFGNNVMLHVSPGLSGQLDCLAVHQNQQRNCRLLPQRQQENDCGPVQQQHAEECFLLPQERSLFPRVLPLQPQQERLLIMPQEQQDEHLLLLQCAHERSVQRSNAAGAGTGEAPILAAVSSRFLLHKSAVRDNSPKQEAPASHKDSVGATVFSDGNKLVEEKHKQQQ